MISNYKYSKKVKGSSTYKRLELFLPVRPVPASRPRISRYGSYYTKTYTDFRREAYSYLKQVPNKFNDTSGRFKITLEIISYRPKKPSKSYPRGDNDNYEKSYYDSITYAGIAWDDDVQIVENITTKRYQEEGEDYGARIIIEQLKGI